jgi:hypothetical protein
LRETCSYDSADEVDAREVRLAQISSMPTEGFLSDVVMVKAMTTSSVLMGETWVSGDLFAILLLFRHDGVRWLFVDCLCERVRKTRKGYSCATTQGSGVSLSSTV